MTYTIGQVSQMFDLPISTLRYYDKEGLFPNMHRESGIRRFTEQEIESLRTIECLKRSGIEIKDIKQFISWCTEGSKTYLQRRQLFIDQKEAVEKEIKEMKTTLNMLKYKCWYYDTAISEGGEEGIAEKDPKDVPSEIRTVFKALHKDHHR
jgi:DNA-binding transcriptional MerR regulator